MFVLSNKIHPTKVLRKFSFWDNLIFSYSEMTFCFKYAVGDSDGKKSNSSRLISICYHISSSTIAKMLQFQSAPVEWREEAGLCHCHCHHSPAATTTFVWVPDRVPVSSASFLFAPHNCLSFSQTKHCKRLGIIFRCLYED